MNSKFAFRGSDTFLSTCCSLQVSMDADSPPNTLTVSFPIRGMERVVATVTGYSGIERFDLIKLISKAGGNYVGSMSQSITHLICWKYKGPKYKLARKFKTVIVNHQWIEDCIKAGRRLPESPYTHQCGQEVGPLALKPSQVLAEARDQSQLNDQKEPGELHPNQLLIDLEKRNSALPESSHGGRRRRLVKKNAVKETLIITSDSEDEIPGRRDSHEVYGSEAVPSLSAPQDEKILSDAHARDSISSESGQTRAQVLSSRKRSNCSSPEPSGGRRRRRLVKKSMTKETLKFTSESKEGSGGQADFHHHSNRLDVSNHSGPKDEIQLIALHACGSTSYECGQYRNEDLHDANRTEGLNDDDSRIEGLNDHNTEDVDDVHELDDESLLGKGASPDQVNDIHNSRNAIESSNRLPASTDLSCVICWTNFSATRGVLPCGHRFCFSCIQSWVDYMASSKKTSTCPLCKAAFSSITKVDDALSSDQKIYSQTLPDDDDTRMERIPILTTAATPNIPSHSLGAPVCSRCHHREPEDLLQRCNLCWIQSIHTYCLDPPLFPWTCGNCKDLQRLYQHIR